MIIYQKEEDYETRYFLSDERSFNSVVGLISYYEKHNLGENFAKLVLEHLENINLI